MRILIRQKQAALWLLLWLGCFCQFPLLAQQTDSSLKNLQLHEVLVCDKNEHAAAFSFYRNSRLATTEDIMSRMQGLYLIRRGAYGMEPSLRSYSGAQVNMTIGGMHITGACTDRMDPASIYIETANLQSIQINHGASGSFTGSGIGGSINLLLKEAEFNCHRRLTGSYASLYSHNNSALSQAIALNISNSTVALRLSGTYRNGADYYAGRHLRIHNSAYEKANVSGNLLIRLSEKKRLKLDYLGDRGWYIGYPALPMDVGKANADIYSISYHYASKNSTLQSHESKVYYNQVIHYMDDTHRKNIAMHMDMPGWSNTWGFYNESLLKTGKRNSLQLRADVYRNFSKADMTMYPGNQAEPAMFMLSLPDNIKTAAGIALKEQWCIDTLHVLGFQLRAEWNELQLQSKLGKQQWEVFGYSGASTVSKGIYSASIFYSFPLAGRIHSTLSTGYAERMPGATELFGYYLFNRSDAFDYLGYPALRKERSLQAEYNIRYEAPKSKIQVSLFCHRTLDYIMGLADTQLSAMTIGARGVKVYANAGQALLGGVEASMQNYLGRHWQHFSSAKMVQGQVQSGQYLPMTPPLKCLHSLRYKNNRFEVQAENEWALPQSRYRGDLGEYYTPAYMLFNLRGAYRIPFKQQGLLLSLAVENITDTRYREHLDIGRLPRSGRNIQAGLQLYFL